MTFNASSLFNEHALSLYVHYPFCVQKCPYCDFASEAQGHRTEAQQREDAHRDHIYVDLLIEEFKYKLDLLRSLGDKRSFVSLYVGGGTPSLCEPKELSRLLEFVGPYLHPDAEISMEANPGTVDSERFSEFKAVGFNRLSIGVQSFNDKALKRLGRIHNAEDAINACKIAKKAGFTNFNIDLMHGLPRQDVELALYDLRQALALESTHLSWYELTLEEDTPFGAKPPVLPDEDILADIEEAGFSVLKDAGFKRYEVSGFAKDDEYRCVHNQNYWVYGDYMGIGAAAHQKLSFNLVQDGVSTLVTKRSFNEQSFKTYKEQFAKSKVHLEDNLLLELGLKIIATTNSSSQNAANKASASKASACGSGACGCSVSGGACLSSGSCLSDSGRGAYDTLLLSNGIDLNEGFTESKVEPSAIPFEYMLNRARLFDRVDAKEYKLHTGMDIKSLSQDLTDLAGKGLISLEEDYSFTITKLGCTMLNQILEAFLDYASDDGDADDNTACDTDGVE